jgi:hypothetical protein
MIREADAQTVLGAKRSLCSELTSCSLWYRRVEPVPTADVTARTLVWRAFGETANEVTAGLRRPDQGP